VGTRQALGDKEFGELDTEMDSFDDNLSTKAGVAAVRLEFGVAR
jgi:hypothetical protein